MPPSVRAVYIWAVVVFIGTMIVAWILVETMLANRPSHFVTTGLTFVPVAAAVAVMNIGLNRVRKRVWTHPAGLCSRCEYPLPDQGDEPVIESMEPIRCSECGLLMTAYWHQRRWENRLGPRPRSGAPKA